MYKVYCLKDRNEIRYIGYTKKTLNWRLKKHKREYPDQRSNAVIELLQEVDTKDQAKSLEVLYTLQYKTRETGWNIALGHINNDGASLKLSGMNTRFGNRERYPGEEEKRKANAALGAARACSKPVRCITTGLEYPSARACAKALGLQTSALSLVLKGKRPHTRGLKFEFIVPK